MTIVALTGAAPLHAQRMDGASRMTGAGPVSMGGFAGARVRIALGGTRSREQRIRAGLTVAPMQRSSSVDMKSSTLRIGDGFEFGIAGDRFEPHLSLAGQRLIPARQLPGGRVPTKGRSNLSDGGAVAVVVAGIAVLAGVGLLLALDAAGDPDRCCE